MFWKQLLSAVCLTALAACATVTTAPVERKVGRTADIGVKTSAAVGAVMYGEFDYASAGGATMLSPVEHPVAFGRAEVPVGARLIKANVDGKPGFCTVDLTYIEPLYGPYRSTCYYDNNKDGTFETMWVAPGSVGFEYDLETPARYSEGEVAGQGSGYKYELLYQGVDDRTLRIGYREYKDNFARPAFSQDLTYPMSPDGPTQIRFKDVRIEVFSADASEVSYVVLSGFE